MVALIGRGVLGWAVVAGVAQFAEPVREGDQTSLDPCVDSFRWKLAGRRALARGRRGQDLDALVDAADWIDGELAARDRLAHVGAQHQMLDVGGRDQDTLSLQGAARDAGVEEALDLFVDPADGLDLAKLIDRAGDRE